MIFVNFSVNSLRCAGGLHFLPTLSLAGFGDLEVASSFEESASDVQKLSQQWTGLSLPESSARPLGVGCFLTSQQGVNSLRLHLFIVPLADTLHVPLSNTLILNKSLNFV